MLEREMRVLFVHYRDFFLTRKGRFDQSFVRLLGVLMRLDK